MEGTIEKKKKASHMLKKTWERCKSFHTRGMRSPPHEMLPSHRMVKSKSWSSFFATTPTSPQADKWGGFVKRSRVSTPKGCLSIYVGPEKQKFVIKVECTNHPLFEMLLEEAELEYGYHSNGPIELPCNVDKFIEVLFEMEADRNDQMMPPLGCSLRGRNSYLLLSPSSTKSMVSLDQLA